MKNSLSYSPWIYPILLAFAATAVASIALQNLAWVAVVVFLLAQWQKRQKINWPQGLFPVATLLFLATFFLGALVGVDPANSFQTVHKYLTILLFFFIAAMPLTFGEVQKLVHAFLYGAAFCSLYGIVVKHFIHHQDRLDSFSGDKMVFGGLLMVALLFNLVMLKKNPKKWHFWICAWLIATALVFTQTRGAWLGFLVGGLLLLWNLNRRWFLGAIVLIILSYFLLPRAYQERIKSIGDIQMSYSASNPWGNSSQTRFLIWAAGWHMIEDHPLGVGQGNVSELFPKYKPYQLQDKNEPHLHDNFLQICAQNGWLGLAAYLFWIVAYGGTALRFKGGLETAEWNWTFFCVFLSVLVWGLTEYTFSHQFMNVQFFLLGLQTHLWKTNPESKNSA
jgi:O-antigen ligase